MIPFALLAVLLDSILTVPHSGWHNIELKVTEPDTIVECSFEVQGNASMLQALLLSKREADRFQHGRSSRPVTSTGYTRAGTFRIRVVEPGPYVLILDNRLEGRAPSEVRVSLKMNTPRAVQPRELSAHRRGVVIAISLLFFVGIFSAALTLGRRRYRRMRADCVTPSA